MRILFVSDKYSIHTVRWVNALVDRGNEVHLASRDPAKPLMHQIDQRVFLHSLGNYRNIASVRAGFILRKIARQIKPDLVNAHYASSYGLTARIANWHPLLLNVWGSDVYAFPYKHFWNMLIIRKNLRAADRIASTSLSMASQVRRLLGKNADFSISITPFGVDNRLYSKKPSYSNEQDEIIIGLIKALKPVYGLPYLLEAMPMLISRLQKEAAQLSTKVRLHIYGEGECQRSLQEMVKQLQLEHIVIFKGYVSNDKVPDILSGMSIVCLPSIRESFGVSAVEAMAAGLPVVATDTDGFSDIVVSGQTGIIVPVQNASAISDALYKLCVHPELRQAYGQAGQARARENFEWSVNVDTMEAIYREMVEMI